VQRVETIGRVLGRAVGELLVLLGFGRRSARGGRRRAWELVVADRFAELVRELSAAPLPEPVADLLGVDRHAGPAEVCRALVRTRGSREKATALRALLDLLPSAPEGAVIGALAGLPAVYCATLGRVLMVGTEAAGRELEARTAWNLEEARRGWLALDTMLEKLESVQAASGTRPVLKVAQRGTGRHRPPRRRGQVL